MLGVVQIQIHQHRKDRHDDDVQQILRGADLGQPPGLGQLVDDADLSGALGDLPDDDEEGDDLRGDIVHHQREERLVGVEAGLEPGRDHGPDGACGCARGDHDGDQQPAGQLVAQQDHAGCSRKAAGQDLSVTAEVPAAHAEGRRHSQGDHQQNGGVLQQHPDTALAAKGAVEDRDIDVDRVLTGQQHRDQTGENYGQKNGRCANAQSLIPGQSAALGNMNQRFVRLLIHRLFLPDGSSSGQPRVFSRRGRGQCHSPCRRRAPGCGRPAPAAHRDPRRHR